ncbi:follicular epithelium yolk protein subunit [Silvanigrella aquatica]|uniref:Follicular epithelium yolk protein subunit n=1 Tax=Silvanigrella aquatica TaxID=1915309 RepID=A0A1L4D161_9BACT|nr:follicular epithelium yolk protein subunit [Silvanigrella aquatica]APJ03924.1 hypothetical protein AXG55_08410 [Silvanigrella aquatica]
MSILLSVIAGMSADHSSASGSGQEIHIITDKERESFGIGNDQVLKKAVEAYFGKSPDDVYLKSDTPWDDLYKTYNWSQVQTNYRVRDVQILEITSQPEILAKKTFENKSSKSVTYNASISDTRANTLETHWSQSTNKSVGFSIKASFSVPGVFGFEGGSTFNFDSTWGEGGFQSTTTTVGTTTGIIVTLDPGEKVEAHLNATRGHLKVRVNYDTYLTGITAVNYAQTYKEHHFWGLPIDKVLKSSGINNNQIVTQDLNFSYYSDAHVVVYDQKGREKRTINASFN